MPSETRKVFIDTQVFDQYQLGYGSRAFNSLRRLVAAGEMDLVLTEVTVGEVRSHIAEKAEEAAKMLKELKSMKRGAKDVIGYDTFKELELFTGEVLADRMTKAFNDFLIDMKAEVIKVDSASASEVVRRYFEGLPPFSSPKKKAEFPDAIAADALKNWCKQPLPRKLYVVTDDPDWRRFCDEVDEFIYVKHLGELLEHFADEEQVAYLKSFVTPQNRELIAAIEQAVEDGNMYFFVEYSEIVDAEVVEVSNVDVTIEEVNITDACDGSATLSVVCAVTVSLYVTGKDPDSTWRDPDDGSWHSVWTASGTVERDFEVEATVEVSYEFEDPEDFDIMSVAFQKMDYGIDIDENELETRYDADDDDEPDSTWFPDEEGPPDDEPPGGQPVEY